MYRSPGAFWAENARNASGRNSLTDVQALGLPTESASPGRALEPWEKAAAIGETHGPEAGFERDRPEVVLVGRLASRPMVPRSQFAAGAPPVHYRAAPAIRSYHTRDTNTRTFS